MELVNVQVMLLTGGEIILPGVPESDMFHVRERFARWVDAGAIHATRDDYPDTRMLELVSETAGQSVAVPFAAVAALLVTPRRAAE